MAWGMAVARAVVVLVVVALARAVRVALSLGKPPRKVLYKHSFGVPD